MRGISSLSSTLRPRVLDTGRGDDSIHHDNVCVVQQLPQNFETKKQPRTVIAAINRDKAINKTEAHTPHTTPSLKQHGSKPHTTQPCTNATLNNAPNPPTLYLQQAATYRAQGVDDFLVRKLDAGVISRGGVHIESEQLPVSQGHLCGARDSNVSFL